MCGNCNCNGSNSAGEPKFCNGNYSSNKVNYFGDGLNLFNIGSIKIEKNELELLRKEVELYRNIITPEYLKNDLWMRGFYSGRESIGEQEENPNKSISQLAEEYWVDDRESLIQSELSKLEKLGDE